MSYGLSPRAFQHKGRRALRRMSERQRAIFFAVRFEDASYAELAERYEISSRDRSGIGRGADHPFARVG